MAYSVVDIINLVYTWSVIDSSVDIINFNKFKTEKRGKVGNGEWGKVWGSHEDA